MAVQGGRRRVQQAPGRPGLVEVEVLAVGSRTTVPASKYVVLDTIRSGPGANTRVSLRPVPARWPSVKKDSDSRQSS